MRRTVVVPLSDPRHEPDGVSEEAIPYARLLAERIGAGIVLVSVIDAQVADARTELDDWAEPYRAMVCGTRDPRRAERLRYLQDTATHFDGLEVQTIVQYGAAADEILHVARRFPQPAIVMAGHGRSGLRRLILGSVALEVVKEARCPVLIVPVPEARRVLPQPLALHRVLVPIDDTFLAEPILDATLAALGTDDVELHLLEVSEPIPARPDVVAHEQYEAAREPQAHFLRRVAEELRERGHRVTWELRIGEPSAEIARAAEEAQIDLVAMPTDGRSGFNRLIFGTTGERVATHRPVPILLVRPARAALQQAVVAAQIVRESELPMA
jgi:nucleotide-binding universal stress UspA family protein